MKRAFGVCGLIILLGGCKFTDEEAAYETCIASVSSRLVSPSTATFSSISNASLNRKIKKLPNDGVLRAKWNISGHVDSQNKYGALIKQRFNCEVIQWKREMTLKKLILGTKTYRSID